MSLKRVGILRGGTGDDYGSSLREGGNLILHIHENLSDKFKVVDIFVDRSGVWHVNGLPVEPAGLVHKVDVVWNTGEPSFLQTMQSFSIPTIGVSSFSSGIAQNRSMLEEHMKNFGINMPRHLVLPLFQEDFDGSRERYAKNKAREVFEKFPPPWIVRSYAEEPDMGVHVANTFPELERAILDGIHHEQSILVEELIPGKVASVHSVRGFRGEDFYTFPIENLLSSEKQKLTNLSKHLHEYLGAYPYLKSNFVVTPKGKLYLTGVLFSPNLKENSHFAKVCASVGAKMHHVVEHIINTASV